MGYPDHQIKSHGRVGQISKILQNSHGRVKHNLTDGNRSEQVNIYTTNPAVNYLFASKKKLQKDSAPGIPRWSPTPVLLGRTVAYVWQIGRDAQFSTDYGRIQDESGGIGLIYRLGKAGDKYSMAGLGEMCVCICNETKASERSTSNY